MTSNLEQKKLYEAKVSAELDKLNAQIDELRAKAKQAKANTQLEYQDYLEMLSVKQAATQSKLQELQTAAEGAWGAMQAGVEAAWEDLKTSFDQAMIELGMRET